MDTIRACISFQAGAASKVIARMARARLAPHGITPIQFAVLHAVSEAPDQTAAEVGAALIIDSATIVGVIDRLAHMELVSRQPDPDDRRVKRLSLTAQGAAALPKLRAVMDDLNAEIDAILGPAAGDVRESLQALVDLPTN
ncbi:MAG: MarR family transcriptional regulator [Pseudomonadota bacterium]